MSPPSGYPTDGVHHILVNGHWVGDEPAPGVDNIVVNNHYTDFYFRWLNNVPSGGCTYEISLGSHPGNWVREDVDKWVNVKNGQYQQWILKKTADTYTIGLPGKNLVWTDTEPNGPVHNQVQLTVDNPKYYNPKQHFHIY